MEFKRGDTIGAIGTTLNFNENSIVKGFYVSKVEWVNKTKETPHQYSMDIITNKKNFNTLFLNDYKAKIYNVRMVLFEKVLDVRF